MAHYAQLNENNEVINVIVISNEVTHDQNGLEVEALGIEYCKDIYGQDTKWIQTSFNSNFRNKYAGIGDVYISERDAFIPPQPFPSWALHPTENKWVSPIPEPDDDRYYRWDENTQQWVAPEVQEELTTGE